MTKVRFFSEKDTLVGFEISGHSGYADEGYDIVCAGVSSAAYLTANTVTEIFGLNAEAVVKEGYMFFRVAPDKRADALFRGLKLHFRQFYEQYPNFITIEND